MQKRSTLFFAFFACLLGTDVASSQTVIGQQRRVKVETRARDAIFDEDDVIRKDKKNSGRTGSFLQTVGVNSATITGDTRANAFQTSMISGISFQADGEASTWSIEDGSSRSSAESFFRLKFELNNPGTVVFDQLFLEAMRPQINDDPRDDEYERSDQATLYVRIFNLKSGQRVYNKTVKLDTDETFDDFDDNVDVDLPAGAYRMDIKARIVGTDLLNSVQGQPRAAKAYFFVEGFLTENEKGN